MIYLDIDDGVLVDFVGTAKKFGMELEHNKFGVWCWYGSDKCELCKDSSGALWDKCHLNFPTPAEFYAVAEPQEWMQELIDEIVESDDFSGLNFLTVDNSEEKEEWIKKNVDYAMLSVYESPDKSVRCKHPTDLLIDDNPEECERWRQKGGIAYWFNLAEENPFEKFLKWWRLGR